MGVKFSEIAFAGANFGTSDFSMAVQNGTTDVLFTNAELFGAMSAANPISNDGAAIGSSSLQWSDLFLASGGVINWSNGTLTLSQSSAVLTMAGASATGTVLTIQNTDNGSIGGNLTFFHDSNSPAISDNLGRIDFSGRDNAGPPGNLQVYASVRAQIASAVDTAEAGVLLFSAALAGTNSAVVSLDGTTMRPNTNDQISLGIAGTGWSDLFLAAGGVINWNNGTATMREDTGSIIVGAAAVGGGLGDALQVNGTGTNNSSMIMSRFSNDANDSDFRIIKSRGTSVGSNVIVQTSDELGAINWYASSNSGYTSTTLIKAIMDAGTISSTSLPTRLQFSTTPDGTITPTVRMIITAAGQITPGANDGTSLGTATVSFSDLFLAAGAVINFNNSGATLTESSGNLTYSNAVNGIFTMENTNAGSFGSHLVLYANSASPAASDTAGSVDFQGEDSAGNANTYSSISSVIVSPTNTTEAGRLDFLVQTSGATTVTAAFDGNWFNFNAAWGSTEPVTKTGTSGSQATTDSSLIMNASGTYTLTLLSAATYSGRWLCIKNIAAQTVNSASSNVVPLAGGAAGTAILSNVAGRWALLQSDGTNWVIMAGVT